MIATLLESLLLAVWWTVCAVIGVLVLALVGIGTVLAWLHQPEGRADLFEVAR